VGALPETATRPLFLQAKEIMAELVGRRQETILVVVVVEHLPLEQMLQLMVATAALVQHLLFLALL
jgi:hypothetical protein